MKTSKNLRKWLGVTDEYVGYCREERNFAAVLYHLLLDERRRQAFLELVEHQPADGEKAGVYFEYAHLRDLWAEVAKRERNTEARNARYRNAIIAMLDRPDIAFPEDCEEFNRFFIGEDAKAASKKHIQMPSRWRDSQFHRWEERSGMGFAERACMLKWAFNAKPDLVLHLGDDKAICVEAKLESGVSHYSVRGDRSRGGFSRTQLEVQEFILKDLLGYTTDFVIISKTKRRKDDVENPWRKYTWREVFAALTNEHGEPWLVSEFCKSKIIEPA